MPLVAARMDTLARYCRAFTPTSLVRYAKWRSATANARQPIQVQLRSGLCIELRPDSSDVWIASELFIRGQYDPPVAVRFGDIRTVVDVGANVGYASLLFLSQFPEATVTAFEPLPAHVEQIRKHARLNGFEERLTLVPAAASTADGEMSFRSAGAASSLAAAADEGPSGDTVTVPVVDWYAHLPPGPIDLLKMDIEGGEFALMNDARFDDVARRTRVLVLEWHKTDDYPEAREWCAGRLEQTGFRVFEGDIDYGHAGLLWAAR